MFPNWPDVGHGRWEAALGPIQQKLVVLLPSFERVVERNRTRTGRAHLNESTLQIMYDDMLAWRGYADAILIDNGDLTAGETVEMIQSLYFQRLLIYQKIKDDVQLILTIIILKF